MTTKTLGLNDLLAKSEKTALMWEEKAREERTFAAFLGELIPSLPDLPFTRVHQHNCYGDATLELEVESLGDVAPLIAAMPPVETVLYQDSCTSLRPASHPQTKERGTRTPIHPVFIEVDNVTQPRAEVVWYATIGGKAVKVEVTVKKVYDIARWTGTKSVRGGSVVMSNKSIIHKLHDPKVIKWWSGPEYHMKATFYWPVGADTTLVLTPRSDTTHTAIVGS